MSSETRLHAGMGRRRIRLASITDSTPMYILLRKLTGLGFAARLFAVALQIFIRSYYTHFINMFLTADHHRYKSHVYSAYYIPTHPVQVANTRALGPIMHILYVGALGIPTCALGRALGMMAA